jgi:hypothetical protein
MGSGGGIHLEMSKKPNPRPKNSLSSRYDLPMNNKVLPPSLPVKKGPPSTPEMLAKLTPKTSGKKVIAERLVKLSIVQDDQPDQDFVSKNISRIDKARAKKRKTAPKK